MNEISVNVIQNQKKVRERISSEVRQLIIANMNNGMSGEQVAKVVKHKPNTVTAIYRRYRKTGIKINQIRGRRKGGSILSDAQKRTICGWVDHNCTLTLKELVEKVLQEWPISGLNLWEDNRKSTQSVSLHFQKSFYYSRTP